MILLSSEVDSGSSSDSEVEQEQRKERPKAFVFSDDEDDTKRVVRTLKDKRFEELQTIIKQMKNHKKIKDMAKGESLIRWRVLERAELCWYIR